MRNQKLHIGLSKDLRGWTRLPASTGGFLCTRRQNACFVGQISTSARSNYSLPLLVYIASSVLGFAFLCNSIPTPPPNHGTIYVEHIWHGNQQSTDTSQDSQCPMNTHILIERDPDNCHPTRSAIPGNRHETQCRGSIDAIRVDDIHVRADEYTDRTEAEEAGCEYR